MWALPVHGAEWSITEAHLAFGNLDIPMFAGGGDSDHFIYTLQHASGWKYGDNFFFIDFLDAQDPGFQDFDIYGEWYSNFSLGKIAGRVAGAPRESNSCMVDFNFARPFTIGKANLSIEGHLEYIGGRDNEFGGKVEPWILAQPQFRWSPNEHLSLGLEYQYWLNKLGDGATDENTVQALLVCKF